MMSLIRQISFLCYQDLMFHAIWASVFILHTCFHSRAEHTLPQRLCLEFSDVRNGGLHCSPAVALKRQVGGLCLLRSAAQQWWMSFALRGLCEMSARSLWSVCGANSSKTIITPTPEYWQPTCPSLCHSMALLLPIPLCYLPLVCLSHSIRNVSPGWTLLPHPLVGADCRLGALCGGSKDTCRSGSHCRRLCLFLGPLPWCTARPFSRTFILHRIAALLIILAAAYL